MHHYIQAIVLLALFSSIALSDIRFHRIPNNLLFPLAISAWSYRGYHLDLGLVGRTTAIVVGYLVIYLSAKRSLGAGDVKLALALSFMAISWLELYELQLISWLAGGVGLALRLLVRRANRPSAPVAFAPYLLLPALWLLFHNF
jgi:Flp pilus assembly protein protease CpaA